MRKGTAFGAVVLLVNLAFPLSSMACYSRTVFEEDFMGKYDVNETSPQVFYFDLSSQFQNPADFLNVKKAVLTFTVSDHDRYPERIRAKTGPGDGGVLLVDRKIFGHGKTVSINLLKKGLPEGSLADGKLEIEFSSPDLPFINDYKIKHVSLTVWAEEKQSPASVPLPISALLLFTGLGGIAVARRRSLARLSQCNKFFTKM